METDTAKLRTHCCGLNYRTEGPEVELKPDSEYPDWLFTMRVERPEPTSDQLEPGTMEYFFATREEARLRKSRLDSKWHNLKRRAKRRKEQKA